MNELIKLDRREMLQASTGLLMGLVVAGSPLAVVARGCAWAVDLAAFTSSEGAILVAVARTIMPHDKLEDAAYALVIKNVDADAAKDEGTRVIMKAGIAGLGTGFASRSESERVQALKSIETSKFFRLMREKTVQVLYSTPMAYTYFGYEGEAFSKGGYLVRGFNDLRWLPEVPIGESGPMPVKA